MNSFEQFLHKQESVFDEFRSTMAEALETGLEIPAVDTQTRSGDIIFFGFDNRVEELSATVADVFKDTPFTILPAIMLHSTITVVKPAGTFQDVGHQVKELVSTYTKRLREIQIEFREVLFNNNSVILAGYPNQTYWITVENIISGLSKLGIQARYPKLAHITLARSSNSDESNLETELSNRIVKNLSGFESLVLCPMSIQAGSFEQNAGGFRFTHVN